MKKNVLVNLAFTGILMGATSIALAHGESDGHKKVKSQKMAMVGACHGVNACKGKGACMGKTNGCAGHNSCAGKGWLKLSKKECDAKKGTFKKIPM